MERTLPDIALCFNRSMRRASNRLIRLYDDSLSPSGLKAVEFAILAQIERIGCASLMELADAFMLDRSSFRYKVAPLERANLVAVVADTRDGRARRLILTEAGAAKLAEGTVLWREAQRRFEGTVGASEAAALRATMDMIASPAFGGAFRASAHEASDARVRGL